MSYPGHSTHLLQPLNVGLFAPLQNAYGKAASDFICETRTGITKGAFWKFNRQAKESAYTKGNIKEAWRGTAINDMESDREWDGIEVQVCNQPPQHRYAPAASEVKDLYQAVPLTTGQTLVTIPPPRGGGCNGGGGNDGLRSG